MISLPEDGIPEELLTFEEQDNLDDIYKMLDLSFMDQIMMEIGGELNFLKDCALSDVQHVQQQQQLSTMVTDKVELLATSGDDMLSQSDDSDGEEIPADVDTWSFMPPTAIAKDTAIRSAINSLDPLAWSPSPGHP